MRSRWIEPMEDHSESTVVAFTPFGVFFLVSVVLLILLGAAASSGALLFLGIIGVIVLAVARFQAPRNLAEIRVERLLPERVATGDSFLAEVRLANDRRRGMVRDVELDDRMVASSTSQVFFGEVAPGAVVSGEYAARVFQRGRYTGRQFILRSSWPLGLYRAERGGRFAARRDMVVIPRPIFPDELRLISRGSGADNLWTSGRITDSNEEFRTLRSYQPGDPAKLIHWPKTSRAGSLIVRENEPPLPPERQFGLWLHQYHPDARMVQPRHFETMLRMACGLLIWMRQGDASVRVRIDFLECRKIQVPADADFNEVLDSLALARSRPVSERSAFPRGLDWFSGCDRIFVVGDSPRAQWEEELGALRPRIRCLDSCGDGWATIGFPERDGSGR